MGHTTRIPDAELRRGDPVIDPDEEDAEETTETRSKVVTPQEKKPPVSTTRAVTKDV